LIKYLFIAIDLPLGMTKMDPNLMGAHKNIYLLTLSMWMDIYQQIFTRMGAGIGTIVLTHPGLHITYIYYILI